MGLILEGIESNFHYLIIKQVFLVLLKHYLNAQEGILCDNTLTLTLLRALTEQGKSNYLNLYPLTTNQCLVTDL